MRNGIFSGIETVERSWTFSVAILTYFITLGVFDLPLSAYLIPVAWITLGATLVESIPMGEFDNSTITLAAVIVGWMVF